MSSRMKNLYLLQWICLLKALGSQVMGTQAFHVPPSAATASIHRRLRNACRHVKKTSGSASPKGFGAAKSKITKRKKPSKQQVLKQLERKYGGTSAEHIAQATQKLIEKEIQQLPVHVQVALQLFQQLEKWDSLLANMSILDQANIPASETEGAQRARHELKSILKEHGLTNVDLRNTLQQITWDASADAKAARSLTGQMSADIAERVDTVCAMAAEVVMNPEDRCLDIGCGFGVLFPQLTKRGRLHPSQVFGIDLSPEMIRNARELHGGTSSGGEGGGPTWQAVDFIQDFTPPDDITSFAAVIFCASLHDMPDMDAALHKAWALVQPSGGRLIIAHPQGATHVAQQSRANPVLVPRGLPTTDDYHALNLPDCRLLVEPAKSRPEQDRLGYLAVLEKTS